jgi:hypothetical protein
MNKQLRGAPVTNIPKPKTVRKPKWWVGALTLLFIIFVGSLVATSIQTGMSATENLDSRIGYGTFFALALPGMTAGGLVENNGHLPTFHSLYREGRIVCIIVNTLFYSILIVLWVMYHGDERLELDRREHERRKISRRIDD